MKLVVIYRPNSEHAREIEAYLHDFTPMIPANVKTEMINVDTRDGAATAALYDVVSYPGILVTTDDGIMLQSWSGSMLPLMGEVASYLHG